MTMYSVRAIKYGSGFQHKDGIIKHIDVPGSSERDAMRKAEMRLGAKWGVVSATDKKGSKK